MDARAGFEPASTGHEPVKEPLLHLAVLCIQEAHQTTLQIKMKGNIQYDFMNCCVRFYIIDF